MPDQLTIAADDATEPTPAFLTIDEWTNPADVETVLLERHIALINHDVASTPEEQDTLRRTIAELDAKLNDLGYED